MILILIQTVLNSKYQMTLHVNKLLQKDINDTGGT